MLEKSSGSAMEAAGAAGREAANPRVGPAGELSTRTRALMLLLGYVPLLHAGSTLALLALGASDLLRGESAGPRLALALGILYLLPPLAVRAGALAAPAVEGKFCTGSRQFLAWWFCAQWQVVFNRLSFLEEALRLVPSLYSAWLRLFGARVGKLVYWSPGVVVLDRQLLEVGDRAVIGAGARIAAHYFGKDEAGRPCLHAAAVRIGHDAVVGGFSLLPAGARVAPHAVTRAARPLRPFGAEPSR